MDTTTWKIPRVGQGVGTFTVVSGKVICSDPCYESRKGTGVKAKNGKWRACIHTHDHGQWGMRVTDLTVWHESVNPGELEFQRLRKEGVGYVDSGQYGFFDEEGFEPEGAFYDDCCSMTSLADWGSTEHGAVSSSGFGDGDYPVEVARENGVAVAFRAIFDEESPHAGIYYDKKDTEYEDPDVEAQDDDEEVG